MAGRPPAEALDARWEVDEFFDRGDEILALGRLSRGMPGSDRQLEQPLLVSGGFAKARDTAWAMSEENVEIVRRVYDATLHGETERVIELLDPRIRLDMSERVFNPAVYEGYEGSRRFFGEIDEVWDDFRAEPLEFIDAGGNVVVAHMVRGRGKESGVEVELPNTSVYTVHDGLVTAIHMYRDHNRALEAAGLTE